LIFTRGIPTFSNENEAQAVIGVFPKIFPYCIRPIEEELISLAYICPSWSPSCIQFSSDSDTFHLHIIIKALSERQFRFFF